MFKDIVALKRAFFCILPKTTEDLSTFSTDAASELDILGHDGDTLGMDGAQVGIFEKTNKVSLTGFLEGHHSRGLESEIGLEVLSDFTNQPLEGKFADEQLSRFLVTTDFSQSDGSRPVTMGFLDTTSGRGTLASSLGGQLLTRGLATGRLASRLLCTCHFSTNMNFQRALTIYMAVQIVRSYWLPVPAMFRTVEKHADSQLTTATTWVRRPSI